MRFEVNDASRKEEIIERTLLVDGVYRIRDYASDAVAVSVFYDDDETLERRVKLVAGISGATEITRAVARVAPSKHPDPVDALIMAAIFWPAGNTQAAVARATGISSKTVRRRMEAMATGHMLERVNFFDFRALTGTLIADLLLYYRDPESKEETDREILSMVRGRLFPPVWPARHSGLFRVLLGNLAEQRELRDRVLELKGVASAYLDVVVEDRIAVEYLYKIGGAFLQRTAGARYAPQVRRLWSRSKSLSTDEIYPRRWVLSGLNESTL